jgi:UDP-N-acetylmuramoyl-L-alanyl-D-glutamate--2,6-diaminopimelate ligase
MQLGALVAAAGPALEAMITGPPLDDAAATVEVSSITHDSRLVTSGALFCCVRGLSDDGHRFAFAAVEAGAAALLCDHPLGTGSTELVVEDVRPAMAQLAAAFHGQPSHALQVVGVTGTNGKTTTVHLLASILRAAGRPTGIIGTLTGTRTTPESTDLQATLAQMRDRGDRAVVLEVSSHSLVQHRVDAITFAAVAFTNLSRDHLDYHASMEDYFKAKASLFAASFAPIAVIDTDGPYGRLLASTTDVPTVVRVGSNRAATGDTASELEILEVGASSSRARWRGIELAIPLGGRFNVSNAVLAAELGLALDAPLDAIAAGIAAAGPVPGRFEQIDAGQPFTIVVDYAHTPDGIEQVLAAARELAPDGRVLVLFGCGGDRDPTKRPFMARAAEEGADLVAVTSDNPRREDPEQILADVLSGFSVRPWLVEPDRRAAIAAVLAEARRGDIVVLAGKGHETTQDHGTHLEPFDDRVVAREEAQRLVEGDAP